MNIITHQVGDNKGGTQIKCHISCTSAEAGIGYANLPKQYANGSTCILSDTLKVLMFVGEPNVGTWEAKN